MSNTKWGRRKDSNRPYIKGDGSVPIYGGDIDMIEAPTRKKKGKEPIFADSFWKGFESKQRVDHLLGTPQEVEVTIGATSQHDILVKYPEGRYVIISHHYSTEGMKNTSGKYYVSTPKNYTRMNVIIIEPDRHGGLSNYVANKQFKNQDGEKTAKQMSKFLKQTLDYDVTFSQFCTPETATIGGVKYK